MHYLAINNKENHDATACCGSVTKEPISCLGVDRLAYTDSGPSQPKIIYSTSPGPALRTDATPEHVPVWEGPAPEEGTPRISGEPSRHKGSAHTSPEGRGLRPLARGAPPRRARGGSYPGAIYLAEIRDLVPGCGQFIVSEASQCPVIKVYM